jgi:hypothetical protein
MGTITTNGDTGPLTGTDIVSWDLTLNDNTNSIELTKTNGQVLLSVGVLTASLTDLSFNFSGPGYLAFALGSDSTRDVLCYQSSSGECVFESGTGAGETVNNIANDGLSTFTSESGNQVIASVPSAAPEPGTGVLLLIGAGILFAMTTHKRVAQALQEAA